MAFALFFLAEYANMILISALRRRACSSAAGCAPFGYRVARRWVPAAGSGWSLKIFVVVSMFLWVRATFPRYRYDQIMRLGWKVFIPVTLVWIVVVGVWMQTPLEHLELDERMQCMHAIKRLSSRPSCCSSCSRAWR